jgi:hypothetical protein
MNIAVKMGIDQAGLSFDNINILKDLEVARAVLNNPMSTVTLDTNVELEEIPPLSEKITEGWQTEESEAEVCPVASSLKKKKKTKTIIRKSNLQQKRGKEVQPGNGSSTSDGDKSMVSPRFNLRDRQKIKKVIK